MIKLKSNVELHLNNGAVLEAAANGTKYTSLVLIDNADKVSVTGDGTLFGNGKNFQVSEAAPNRPYVLFARNSTHVRIENITLKHSAAWTLRLYGCQGVMIKGVNIYSHANFNNDGIDIDSRDVIVSGCNIDCGDDAICLKSENPKQFCENISITNCIVASNCNLIKMGTGSFTGFKNITISNCTLRKASESPLHKWYSPTASSANDKKDHFITDTVTGISGIALEMVDGGAIDQVSISNISMTGVQTPIFIRLGSRKTPTGSLKNVVISNVTATSVSRMCSTISAVPGFYIENVTLHDIILNSKGGGTQADAERVIPENEKAYPENRMFGWSLPAYGLYVRHVKGLTLNNIRFNLLNPDARPAVWLEDTHEVDANQLHPGTSTGDKEWLHKINVTAMKMDK
jgi:polygalacturonase